MKLFSKIGILAAGIIMSVGFVAGIRGNDAIEVSAATSQFTITSANSVTVDGVTVTFDISTGQSTPAWYNAGLRLYANNTVTLTSDSSITDVSFNWEKQGSRAFASMTADVGSYTHPSSAGKGTWSGSAKTIVFKVGSSGQLQLNTFSVETAQETTKTLESISAELITSEKAVWYIGETVTTDYVRVTAYYSDAPSEVVEDGVTLENAKLSSASNVITVRYKEETCTLPVAAVEKPILKSATISGKAVAPLNGSWDFSNLIVRGTSTKDEDMGDITSECTLSSTASTATVGNATIDVTVTCGDVQVVVSGVDAEVTLTTTATDVITRETTKIEVGTNSYTNWTFESTISGATYLGNTAATYDSIQVRSKYNSSSIITQTSGGTLKSISVVWDFINTNTAVTETNPTRTLNIYGSNDSYQITGALYTDSSAGTLVAGLVYDPEDENTYTQTYVFEDDYQYVGIRSLSGAQYITSITINWELPTASELVGDFVDTYMHMEDYTTNQGLCAGEDGYYAKAKEAFHKMKTSYKGSEDLVEVFETEYNDAYLRYLNWAEANGDASPFDGDSINPIIINILGLSEDNSDNMLAIFFSILGCLLFGLIALIMRKRFIRK